MEFTANFAVKLKYRINDGLREPAVRKNNFCIWWKILKNIQNNLYSPTTSIFKAVHHELSSKTEVLDQRSITQTCCPEKNLLQLMEDFEETENFMFNNYSYFNTTVIFNTNSAVNLKYRINNRLHEPCVQRHCCSRKKASEDVKLYVQELLVLQHNCLLQHPLSS